MVKILRAPFVLVLIVLSILLFVYWFFFKKKDYTKLIEVGNDRLLSDTDVELMAQNLLEQMNGLGTGYLFPIFDSITKKDDLLAIIKAFGFKEYYATGLADGLLTRFMGSSLDLQGWLNAEISGSELNQIKSKYIQLGVSFN